MLLNVLEPPSVIKRICERYKAGYSPVIIFCGKMRTGKTTKAYLMLHWVSWLLFGRKWDWRKGTMVSFNQIISGLEDSSEPIKLADEVQRMFEKKDVMKQESRLGNKILMSQAYLHYIFAMIIPRASALGSDFANIADYVIYVKSRKQVLPYKIDNNLWDIDLKKRKGHKFYLRHFKLDIKDKKVQKVFAEELAELEEFKQYINKNLKEPIMQEIKEKRGMQEYHYEKVIVNSNDNYL